MSRSCWVAAVAIAALPLAFGGCAQSGDVRCVCAADEICVYGRCEPRAVGVGDGSTRSDVRPPGGDAAQPACESRSFEMVDTDQSFTAPAHARYMHVKAWGAGGNGEGQCPQDDAGLGGYSEAIFAVVGGTPLTIIVGKRGRAGMSGEDRMRFGFGDWGGGGLSGVFRGADPVTAEARNRALVIAGGGGSAGAPGCHPGGTGNHKAAGGEPTMQGGPGADEINGGGGGYAGGSGGAKGLPGNGGTGFVASEALESRMLSSEPGNVEPPAVNDPDYDGSAGKGETSGRVVIHFVCEQPPLL